MHGLICDFSILKGAIQNLGLKPLTDALESYGGWPITSAAGIHEGIRFDWKVVTASIRKFYRISYLISVYNDLDNYDTKKNSIYVRILVSSLMVLQINLMSISLWLKI